MPTSDAELAERPNEALDWEAREPGLDFARQEARRLLRRARPFRIVLLALSCLVAGLFVAKRVVQRPPFDAQLVLRIVENDKALTDALRPPREYRDFLWQVCLSGPRLRQIIQRHVLYPSIFARDPQLAIETFRDDIDLDIWGNYFDPDYFDPDEARTARVSITWSNRDPDLALAVVRELAATIEAEEADERNEAFRLGSEDVATITDRAEDQLIAVRQRIVRLEFRQSHAHPEQQAGLAVALRGLKREAKEREAQATAMNKEVTHFQLQAAEERVRAGIRFEVIEPGVVLPRHGGGPISTGGTAVLIVFGTWLLSSLLAGAFETRLRSPADVARLGLPTLGALPSFPGDRVGSLSARLRTEDRLRLSQR